MTTDDIHGASGLSHVGQYCEILSRGIHDGKMCACTLLCQWVTRVEECFTIVVPGDGASTSHQGVIGDLNWAPSFCPENIDMRPGVTLKGYPLAIWRPSRIKTDYAVRIEWFNSSAIQGEYPKTTIPVCLPREEDTISVGRPSRKNNITCLTKRVRFLPGKIVFEKVISIDAVLGYRQRLAIGRPCRRHRKCIGA
ncbi:MAG TPA: hypothetical protein DIU35_18450 [Candidatus Latescibacteria bacterium]|nr:hypothetical protein [Candidatus Latescibacterota bacterium]